MLTVEMSTITGPIVFQAIIATVGAGGQGTAKRVAIFCAVFSTIVPQTRHGTRSKPSHFYLGSLRLLLN